MKAFWFPLFLLFIGQYLQAQSRYEVRGALKDTMGVGIPGATVKLVSDEDSVSVRTSFEGEFAIFGVRSPSFRLTITNLGYQTIERELTFDPDRELLLIEEIVLQPQTYELDPISIMGRQPIIIKKDTIEYQSKYYKVRENAFTEDLLKKLPGIFVKRDGSIMAQGKLISRVRVNGKDFFGGDVETAVKNIPANLIERVQIIDDYGDKARLTGNSDGRAQKILNIQTWANLKKGYFGNASAGLGNEGRYQLSALGNNFNNNREMALYGNLNNNNASVAGAGQARPAGGVNGLTALSAAGINYRKKYNKNINTYGSYSFSKSNNRLLSETFRQNIYPDNVLIFNNDTSTSRTVGYNHVFQWNIEYEDSLNFVQVTPTIDFNKRSSSRDGVLTQTRMRNTFFTDSLNQNTAEDMSSSIPLIGARIVANHRFGKSGRNLYAEINLKSGENISEQGVNARMFFFDRGGNLTVDSLQRQFLRNDNNSFQASSRLAYIQPLSANSRLELGYHFSHSRNMNDREASWTSFSRKIDSLSDRYSYTFTTHLLNLSFRHNGPKHAYSVGLSVQPTVLDGESITKDISIRREGLNIIPEFSYSYFLTAEKSLGINYSASSNPPSYLQLQPVTDISNPQYPVTGNPTLKSELWHNFDVAYNSFQFKTGQSLFVNLSAIVIQDQVVPNTVLVAKPDNVITQETLFENINGTYQLGGLYNWSFPVAKRKCVIDVGGSAYYYNSASLSNFTKVTSRNLVLSQSLRMQINSGDRFELYPSVMYTFNRNIYSLDEFTRNNLSTWTMGAGGRFNVLRRLSIGADIDKQVNNGFSGSVKSNPLILNTYIEKQFLKDGRGAIRFTGYDLFDQNTSVGRTIVNNSILDNRSNRLGRYFMLLFTLNISKFDT